VTPSSREGEGSCTSEEPGGVSRPAGGMRSVLSGSGSRGARQDPSATISTTIAPSRPAMERIHDPVPETGSSTLTARPIRQGDDGQKGEHPAPPELSASRTATSSIPSPSRSWRTEGMLSSSRETGTLLRGRTAPLVRHSRGLPRWHRFLCIRCSEARSGRSTGRKHRKQPAGR